MINRSREEGWKNVINSLESDDSGVSILQNELRREKTCFLHMRKQKAQISCEITTHLISTFVFATMIVQFLYLLNP